MSFPQRRLNPSISPIDSPDDPKIGTWLEREGWKVHYIWEWTEAVKIITEFLS
ncbi:hypothetical protein SAMN05192544_11683, partial [Paraburkholderia hospita]